jgi:hypothetical protein
MKKAFLSTFYGRIFTAISPILASKDNGYPYVILSNGSRQVSLMLSKRFAEKHGVSSSQNADGKWVINNANKSLAQFDLRDLIVVDDQRGAGLRLTSNGTNEGAISSSDLAQAFGVQPVSVSSTDGDVDHIAEALATSMRVVESTADQRA